MLVGCGAETTVDSTAQHIAEIEGRLLPRFAIRGADIEQRTLRERMDQLNVPAVSVAVIENGEIAWAKAWGQADVATGRSAETTTLFQAASISKPVAATAMLSLVQDGRLDLDTDVNTYLTSWKVPESSLTRRAPVTLREIVTHTAGFTVHGFPGYARSAVIPTAVEVLDGDGNTPPVTVATLPGSTFSYSGGGYTVMQQLLVDVTGEPFAALMQERVLGPVGMRRSTYAQPLPEARWSEAATGYRADGTPVEENWHVYPEQAAAGLWTTPTDLATWGLAIQHAYAGDTTQVLSPAMARQMLTADAHHWGLGPGMGDEGKTFGHGGSNEGFRCQLIVFLDGSGGVAVMTNGDRGDALTREIVGTIAAEYGWPILQPEERTVVTLDSTVLDEMAGRYELEGVGVLTIAAGDNSLIVDVPGEGQTVLLPTSPTRFFSRDEGTWVTAVRDSGRTVALEVAGRRAVRIEGSAGHE